MNFRRGLKRLWVVGSIGWTFLSGIICLNEFKGNQLQCLGIVVGPIIFAWVLLYLGFWVASGFKEDE